MNRIVLTAAALFFAFSAFAQEAPPASAPAVKPAKPFVYTPKMTDILLGKEDAPVTIVEYASLSCPHCAHFFLNVLPDLTTKYIDTGKARLVYRDYPLNEPALRAAQLVQCADKDRRHAFLKVLFGTQAKWAYDINFKEALAGIAALGGLARSGFDACMSNKALETTIVQVEKEASDDYKVASTPTFFINGKLFQGDQGIDALSKAIDEALKDSAKK